MQDRRADFFLRLSVSPRKKGKSNEKGGFEHRLSIQEE
jgi:hypothetical protein